MTKLPNMINNSSRIIRPIPSFLLPQLQSTAQIRTYQTKALKYRPTPKPTPFVPDTETFLKLIGRKLVQFAPKIPSWKHLFSMTSEELKDIGIINARLRRYLLRWRENYRAGHHGIGGDMNFVQDGFAQLRVVEIRRSLANSQSDTQETSVTKKIVVNVPAGGSVEDIPQDLVKPVHGIKFKAGNTIYGPHVQPCRGNLAKIEVKEGLWEVKESRKIDGGERRRDEVRAKRRGEERRALQK